MRFGGVKQTLPVLLAARGGPSVEQEAQQHGHVQHQQHGAQVGHHANWSILGRLLLRLKKSLLYMIN
jgi:hypothetical protein